MNIKQLNYRHPKYIIPLLIYIPLLILGYFVIDMINFEAGDSSKSDLETVEGLNTNLAKANVRSGLGNKRDNMADVFGHIVDRSAVATAEESLDSINGDEEFGTVYSEEEAEMIRQQALQRDSIKQLKTALEQERREREREKREALKEEKFAGAGSSSSQEARERRADKRRQEFMDELDKELGAIRGKATRMSSRDSSVQVNSSGTSGDAAGSVAPSVASNGGSLPAAIDRGVHALDDKSRMYDVVKKQSPESRFFNTLSQNEAGSGLIKAIIDEEIKAVSGSRVRLRLLDDVVIGSVEIPKGSYLYAKLSNFADQRVKGTVESVMVGDALHRINLSIYDTDGLEGLYVPLSEFRETAKDIGSSALGSNSSQLLGTSYGSDPLLSTATQAMQQAITRTTNAISKAIRKNKVRLKYGTQVYLVNGNNKR